ncbi:hypothetical protein [Lactiplantibacillus pingfangensis]|uniref:hypothetical protein n=1 Tax=Lactiplantibacillus pingfangensis TaxID=2559915 RepID=UPI001485452B|nr:hypothetical protein [Lactiplantibacillus pingfangensis]
MPTRALGCQCALTGIRPAGTVVAGNAIIFGRCWRCNKTGKLVVDASAKGR